MTAGEVTKADVLRAIETERDWWRAAISLAAQNGPLSGNEEINAAWTFRDLIAHVNGWRSRTVIRLEAAANDAGRPSPPWPAHMSDDTETGVDEINAWIQEQSREASLDDTIAEAFALLDRMRAAVERIPDDRLLTPGSYDWMDGEMAEDPIGPALVGSSMSHVHGEHGPDLDPWLTERNGQHAELPPTPSMLGYED